jgi:hypothetical protein
MPATIKNEVGKKYGRLTVIRWAHTTNADGLWWACLCECGREKVVRGHSLRSGATKSCGCLQREFVASLNRTHGLSETRTCKIWKNMLDRCLNAAHKSYKDYGGRGIYVCERWVSSIENFMNDMGPAPDGLSIDRIDNDGPYCPENCRWVTREIQSRNMRTNRVISFAGQTKILKDWADELGIYPTSLASRLQKLPLERALTQSKRGT